MQKEQSDSRWRQLLTTSMTGTSRTKFLAALLIINFVFSDKRKIVYIQFDLIKRSLQFRNWFHPMQHFSLVKLGILLGKLLCWKFFLKKIRFTLFLKKEQSNSWALCLVTWQMILGLSSQLKRYISVLDCFQFEFPKKEKYETPC